MPTTNTLSPEELHQAIAAHFPPNAVCWSQATDEVRDMCRGARELAKVPDEEALNFREFLTPAQWNTQGAAGTVRFYRMLGDKARADFCGNYGHWIGLIAWVPNLIDS